MASKTFTAEMFLDVRCRHGEGPLWMESGSRLYFLDIPGRKLHLFDGALKAYDFDRQITCVLPTDKGRFLASSFDDLHFWSPEAGLGPGLLAASPPFDADIVRHNDGVIAPDGSLIMGCLHMDETEPVSPIYRFTGGHGVRTLMTDQVIANGIDFSPDGKTMYWADTGTGFVYRRQYADGGISSKEVVTWYDPKLGGRPDGLCVDADGDIWVAILGGGRVESLSPKGELRASVSVVGASNVTSCCFGGEDYGVLYITTGHVEGEERSGAVFSCRPGAKGLPPNQFAEGSR